MEDSEILIARMARGDAVVVSVELKRVLQDLGLFATEAAGRLQLDRPLELLDADLIRRNIDAESGHLVSNLKVHWSIDSTNTYLMSMSHAAHFHGSVCLAERQVSGRGRRGRQWVSPFGKNIYLSIGWRLPIHIGAGGLSLVVGMQVARSLREIGLKDVGLKWPNDVLLNGGKLSGILIEIASTVDSKIGVVIGVGVNLHLDETEARNIDQPFSVVGDVQTVSRNELASQLISNLVSELERFSSTGFAHYQAAWNEFNLFYGLAVRVLIGDEVIEGIDRGVDENGHLVLETEQGLTSYSAGEVSLRIAN